MSSLPPDRRADQPRSGVGVLDRSMGVIAAVEAGARTLAAIADRTGLPRPTVHRLLRALEVHGLVRAGDGRTYRLGPALLRLGSAAASDLPLRDVARPALEELTAATGESSQLYVRVGDERVCIDAVESPNELRTIVEVGASLPLTAGSAAKVFLAWTDEADRERLLSRVPNADRVRREVASVRRRGWAQSAGERESGVASVSAPVRGRGDEIVAVVSVSGPLGRLGAARGRPHVPAVVAAARRIEEALGAATPS